MPAESTLYHNAELIIRISSKRQSVWMSVILHLYTPSKGGYTYLLKSVCISAVRHLHTSSKGGYTYPLKSVCMYVVRHFHTSSKGGYTYPLKSVCMSVVRHPHTSSKGGYTYPLKFLGYCILLQQTLFLYQSSEMSRWASVPDIPPVVRLQHNIFIIIPS